MKKFHYDAFQITERLLNLFEVVREVSCIVSKCSFLSFCTNMKYEWCRNGKFRSCNLLWWYFFCVEGISWVFSERTSSCWVSVTSWFNCFNKRLRSSFCIRNDWFAASSLCWCCSRKRSISVWVCSDEKISENCCCKNTDGFGLCPVNNSEQEDSLICRGFCCLLSVGFVFGSTGV